MKPLAGCLLLGCAMALSPALAMAREAAQRPVREAPAVSAQEVAEIRIQGNATVPDEEVLQIAGMAVGDRVTSEDLARVQERLHDSGRFAEVRVERRYRSLTRTDRVVVLIIVREKVSAARKLLVLPQFRYNEDEDFSAGVRLSAKDLLGGSEFLSLPVSFGGVDSVALEVRKDWDSGVIIGAAFGVRRFENPHFEIDDERVRAGAFLRYRTRSPLWVEGRVRFDDVSFGELDENLLVYGVTATFDTLPETAFPYDSVLLSAGWEGLHGSERGLVNRFRLEAAGYKTLIGQLVLAARVAATLSDAPLPTYEKSYVGGGVSLRGSKAGSFIGDNALLGTAELRLPLGPVNSPIVYGVSVFWDTAAVWDNAAALSDAPLHHGVGGGVFFILPGIRLNLDVANNTEGSTRVHFGFGFRF